MNRIEQYFDFCRLLIGEKYTAEDKEIEEAVEKFAFMFPDLDKDEVKKRLLEHYSVPIAPYKTLYNTDNPGAGWLTADDDKRKNDIEWAFWNRYEKYLREKERYLPGVIHQLNRLTNEILDNLFDPSLTDINIQKKGLVVGQVQSGKTSNFTGLICKAVDSGFNVIIVFAGLLDDLRTQTQSRLENCFLGFTTKDIEIINDAEKIGIGVGKIDSSPIAHSFTTMMSDFKETTVNSLGTNFQTNEPILFVVKKNGRILANLLKWLKKKDLSNKSVLFIDDEADNASVNTSKSKDKASTINQKIRDILQLFRRNAYVGYTATPYANIFIDKENEKDLFPRHFIINLPTPDAYLSPEKVFGLDKEGEQPLPIVNVVNDYKMFVPDKHKKDETDSLTYENMPESLKYAIRCFVLSCAVRCARGQVKKHNSMLIHLSRFQIWQNKIKEIVNRYFKYLKGNIISDDKDTYEQLQNDYLNDFICKGLKDMIYKSFVDTTEEIINCEYKIIKSGITPVSWDEVKEHLYYVVDKIEVMALNGSSEDYLAYEDHKDDGFFVIAIGGDKLSRGLTLEGLTVSYFLRASKMYDTLMQMGRWFGYRPKYVDVCRLFVSEEINGWFKNITIANNELREDFDYLWESKGSPYQYALKVRTSPGLFITSPLKMRFVNDVQVSWAAKLVETYSLIRTKKARDNNYNHTSEFIQSLGQRYLKNGEDDPRGFLWTNVSADKVCEFVRNFEIADSSNIKLNLDKMADYIDECRSSYGELNSWRVIVRNRTEKEFEHLSNSDKSKYYFNANNIPGGICSIRTRVNDEGQDNSIYNLRNYHLISGPKDEFLDMYILGEDSQLLADALAETKSIREEQRKKHENLNEWKKDYPSPVLFREKYRPTDKPLLIIYPLNPAKANVLDKDNNVVKDNGVEFFNNNDDPFIAFAIVFPNSRNSQGVKYKVNEVKDLVETEINFENENDNQYQDE